MGICQLQGGTISRYAVRESKLDDVQLHTSRALLATLLAYSAVQGLGRETYSFFN